MKFKMHLKYRSSLVDPVPLVNIIAIIVFFFIMATNFIGSRGIVVDLPQIDQTELYNLNSTLITLSANNIYLFEKEITMNELKEELIKKNYQLLAIKADRNVPYYAIAEIIAMAQSVGIKQIAMASEGGKS